MPQVTTDMIGEEEVTTRPRSEEQVTTQAIGEEGGATTDALGEEEPVLASETVSNPFGGF